MKELKETQYDETITLEVSPKTEIISRLAKRKSNICGGSVIWLMSFFPF